MLACVRSHVPTSAPPSPPPHPIAPFACNVHPHRALTRATAENPEQPEQEVQGSKAQVGYDNKKKNVAINQRELRDKTR